MEIIADGTPLAAYLEGEGTSEPDAKDEYEDADATPFAFEVSDSQAQSFAPTSNGRPEKQARRPLLPQVQELPQSHSWISRLHNAWSTAIKSRLGRADNEKFLEHFRYTIVASQLLNEYLDHGILPQSGPVRTNLDGTGDDSAILQQVKTNLVGAAITAAAAFTFVYLLHWARSSRSELVSKGRVTLAVAVFVMLAFVGYGYVRRQWLKFLRRNAVAAASTLTGNWQAFELSSSSALSFIQEVELVSKGYRLSTPFSPASRIEDTSGKRRCGRLRRALHKAYTAIIPTTVAGCTTLQTLIDADDLEKYFEVYDISAQDAKEGCGDDALTVLDDDAESLKSLRVLSYRAGVMRRVTLCCLMSLAADGGEPDFQRWRLATGVIQALSQVVGTSAQKLQQMVTDIETITIPPSPQTPTRSSHGAAREKLRSQVRKISMLSSGIRGLQAKMQILREETNKSIEQSEDLSDVGPSLLAQYGSIGADLKELMQAWEVGKASLQSKITKQELRISIASSGASGIRSPVSSFGGMTAVEEGGTPADALKALTGGTISNRSSMASSPSDHEQVFEAVAMPKQRSSLTREERIMKVQEERERQATLRAKRESNTAMLRELETVINLRAR